MKSSFVSTNADPELRCRSVQPNLNQWEEGEDEDYDDVDEDLDEAGIHGRNFVTGLLQMTAASRMSSHGMSTGLRMRCPNKSDCRQG